jgi:hypothetical protein
MRSLISNRVKSASEFLCVALSALLSFWGWSEVELDERYADALLEDPAEEVAMEALKQRRTKK